MPHLRRFRNGSEYCGWAGTAALRFAALLQQKNEVRGVTKNAGRDSGREERCGALALLADWAEAQPLHWDALKRAATTPCNGLRPTIIQTRMVGDGLGFFHGLLRRPALRRLDPMRRFHLLCRGSLRRRR